MSSQQNNCSTKTILVLLLCLYFCDLKSWRSFLYHKRSQGVDPGGGFVGKSLYKLKKKGKNRTGESNHMVQNIPYR